MKTLTPSPSDIHQKWYIVDAEGKPLGRLSTKVATILRGKHKPYYVPNIDTGDYVIVINAAKVHVSGMKALQKVYKSYSGYPDGLKEVPYAKVLEKHPERIIEHAVKGMMPKNKLGRAMFKKLKVYPGAEHPHSAQKPIELEI
ncbi:MAG TPA: 50S ribosomal protein L13 [Candidatus Cloacimonas sp.]|jgi:large subunit ribosomal protein L13|nr:50S ribosomal protein L13 [Candidatus Cloacimonas sp.]MDD2249726.1 50S ribosomal protein L13 [Candidatus Cloacimonadota bacterium]MCK9158566.1 50S ribosomal protein L13 [Candidatus Cloacimonas sp.]MCK9165604.1 50S ribosomal protein L13 [Candidatus Cloacimonas sp.]MDD3734203.1 50S ribosomal protein L13 [Candidatus Cloacimonadota bacterium]